MRQHHTLDENDLREHFRTEQWTIYASSSHEPKMFEVMINRTGFRVSVRGAVTYEGQNASDAVRAYNEAV